MDSLNLREKLTRLPTYAGIETLWNILPNARLVGGCVRDLILGYEIHDIDLAISLPPQEIMAILEKEKIRVFPTGIEHGTVTAVIDGHHYEITTLRRDIETDGRHAQVAWTQEWHEDAARRDFTINALFLDKEGKLYDYFSGIEDLKNNIVRFVGDAERRIEEDALRILRFFRFSARYSHWEREHPLEIAAYNAIEKKKSLIGTLSAERIASELLKILAGPHIVPLLISMEKIGVLEEIFPSYTLDRFRKLIEAGHIITPKNKELGENKQEALIETGVILRLYALTSHAQYGKKLKLSNIIITHLHALEAERPQPSHHCSDDAMRRLLVCYRRVLLRDKSWLTQIDECENKEQKGQKEQKEQKDQENAQKWKAWRDKILLIEQPVFPLIGKDLLELGIKPGPEIGQLLKHVQAWWMREGCHPDRHACIEQLRHIIAS